MQTVMPSKSLRYGINAPDRSIWEEFAASASQLQGLILAFISVFVGIIVWFFVPTTQIDAAWLWLALIVSLTIIWLLIDTCRSLHGKPIHYLPKVLKSIPSNGLNNNPILILNNSELFGHGSLVTIFFVNDHEIELQVGSGHVSTIQTDRKIQVEITQWANAHQAVLQGVIDASVDILGRLLVKPTVTSGSIGGFGFYNLDTSNDTETQD